MAIYSKPIPANDIINGCATVCNGNRTQLHDDTSRTKHLANEDGIEQFIVLDGRYKTDPSGWSS